MSLAPFDVSGEPVLDEDGEEVSPGEPHRSLVRYRPDGSETYVFLRMNLPLLTAAVPYGVLRVEPQPRDGELLGDQRSLGVQGHLRNLELFEGLNAGIAASGLPARFLAFETGHGRRDFFYAAEDVDAAEALVRRVAAALGHELTLTRHTMGSLGSQLLPVELAADLGLPGDVPVRRTRFEFSGAAESLAQLSI